MAISKTTRFAPGQLKIEQNANGELVITGKVGVTTFAQTVAPESYPCVIFWNPANANFYAVPTPYIEEGWQFVESIFAATVQGG